MIVQFDRPALYLLRKAQRRREEGRLEEALTLLYVARGRPGADDEVERQIAGVLAQMGYPAQANELLLPMLQGEQPDPVAACLAAVNFMRCQEPGCARDAAALCLHADEEHCARMADAVLEACANALWSAGRARMTGAKRGSGQAHVALLMRRGLDAMSHGSFARAQALLERAASRGGADAAVLLAHCHMQAGDAAAGLAAAQRAVALNAYSVQALCTLTLAQAQAGDREQACETLERAREERLSEQEKYLVACTACEIGQDGIAYWELSRLKAREPLGEDRLWMMAAAAMNTGRAAEATRLLGRLTRLFPRNPVYAACYRYARARRDAGDERPPRDDERFPYLPGPPQAMAARWTEELHEQMRQGGDALAGQLVSNAMFCEEALWVLRMRLSGTPAFDDALRALEQAGGCGARAMFTRLLTEPGPGESERLEVAQCLRRMGETCAPLALLDGRLVRVADPSAYLSPAQARIVRGATDRLLDALGDVGAQVERVWLCGRPRGAARGLPAWQAALECAVRVTLGRPAEVNETARAYRLPPRLLRARTKDLLNAWRRAGHADGRETGTEGSNELRQL